MTTDQTIDSFLASRLGVDRLIGAGRTFEVTTTATIDTPLVLAGGALRFGQVVNPENLILASGTFEITDGDLDIASGTTFDAGSGLTVNVTNGGLNVATGGAYNAIGGSFTASGPSTNDGEINAIGAALDFGGGLINNGRVNLINGSVVGNLTDVATGSTTLAGTISFGDDLELSENSDIRITIAGREAGEFDQMTIGGDATLAGLLSVSLSGGFMPTPGEQFTVLTASDITDNGLALGGPAAGRFSLLVSSTSVILEAMAGLAGDYNNDGLVDAIDYAAWRENLGAPAGTLPNDIDGGVIGAAQLATWKANYGATFAGAASASSSTPEPAAGLLLMLGIAGLATRRRR